MFDRSREETFMLLNFRRAIRRRHSSPVPCYFGQLYDAFRFRYARFNE